MILKKNLFINIFNQQKNNVMEESVPEPEQKVIEESSTNDNKILSKKYFKNRYPLPLEPSLYSPIHLLGEKKTN